MTLRATKDFIGRRPKETAGTLIGAVAVAPIGVVIGGVGLTAMGGGIGVPVIALCGIFGLVGAGIGNRVGVELDRPADNKDPSDKGANE